MTQKFVCSYCEKKKTRKELMRIKKAWICKKCKIKNNKKHREFLKRDILGIRKRADMVIEWAKKRKMYAQEKKLKKLDVKEKESFVPKMRGAKRRSVGSMYSHSYLTKDEKYFLFKQYINNGLSQDAAKNKIKLIVEKLAELMTNLKQEKRTTEDINKRFKEEFAKLIERESR